MVACVLHCPSPCTDKPYIKSRFFRLYQLKETFLVLSWSNQLSSCVLTVCASMANCVFSSLSMTGLGEVEMNPDQNQRGTTSTVSLKSRVLAQLLL